MKIDSGTAILCGAIFATLGWISQQRASRKAERRKRCYEVIDRNQKDKDLHAAIGYASQFRTYGDAIYLRHDFRVVRTQLVKLLDHYEYIAASVWSGDLDETLLFRSERSRIIAIVTVLSPFIERERHRSAGLPSGRRQSTLYRNLTDLAARWQRSRVRLSILVQPCAEWVLQRPIPTRWSLRLPRLF